MRLPHPIPYQGSKRNLAAAILSLVDDDHVDTLYEPFAGSAAITLASAHRELARSFVIGDTLSPLVEIWKRVIDSPTELADEYAAIWQPEDEGGQHYNRVRDEFNASNSPAQLLYLLTRCVKNSPRWNQAGLFNQSPDKRRLGMHPEKMRGHLTGAGRLLRRRTVAVSSDFEETVEDAGSHDLVYLDPPWEGTSGGRDTRYHQGLARDRLIVALERLNERGVRWILSYDGRCGDKTYGEPLPASLGATHFELSAGRSSQATLNGVTAETIESLYVSGNLRKRSLRTKPRQFSLAGL